jgi:hypothetical protein
MIITDNGQMDKLFYDNASKTRNKMMETVQEDFGRIMGEIDEAAKEGMYSVLLEHKSKNPCLLRRKLWDLGYDCVVSGDHIAIGWPDREIEIKEKETFPMSPYISDIDLTHPNKPYNPLTSPYSPITTPVMYNASGTTCNNVSTYTIDSV